MRYLFLLRFTSILIISFFPLLFAQVNFKWSVRFDGPANDWDGAGAINVDDSGYVYVTGGITVNWPDYDYLTIKYSSLGDTIWVKRWDFNNQWDIGHDLIVDKNGNIYVTGGSVTLKYNQFGELLWVSNNQAECFKILADESGDIFVAGTGGVPWGNYVTRKLDKSGIQLWHNIYNGPAGDQDRLRDMVIDNKSNIIVTGGSKIIGNDWDIATIKYAGDTGDTLWVRRYEGLSSYSFNEGYGITSDDSGDVYVTGWSDGIDGTPQCITIKYNSEGDLIWERRFPAGGDIGYSGYDIINDPSGFIYVAARANGYEDVLIKYDYEGNLVWYAQYPASHFFATNQPRLVSDKFRSIYMSSVNSDSLYTYFVVLKYDPDGNREWEYRYHYPPVSGTFSVNFASDLYVDSSLNVYLTGASIISGTGTNSDFLTIKLSQDPVSVTNPIQENPAQYSLLQNYPNPFNPVTQIRYSISQDGFVTLKVFDILGREVETLVNEEKQTGFYTVDFDATDLSSGVYFYSISAGSFHQIKKMLLVK